MGSLELGENLTLPLDAITRKLAFLAVTGAGKTYAATKLAELMLDARAQIVAVDPVGVWYGLRLDPTGKKPSRFQIPVFGGNHGDLPLTPTSGRFIAELIVKRGISAVLDVSMMRPAQRHKFATEFAEEFFHLKKTHRTPVHVFLEECQNFIPETGGKGKRDMVDAWGDIVRLGRNYGIGVSMISQRPQSIDKDALNLMTGLFAFQTTGPHERAAIERWISTKGLEQKIAADLPNLPIGTAHVWAPQWLGISHKVKILPKTTYNASETPTMESSAVPVHIQPIDLAQIKEVMAGLIEQAKTDDPKALRERIRQLEQQLQKGTGDLQSEIDTAVRRVRAEMVATFEPIVTAQQKRLLAIAEAMNGYQPETATILPVLQEPVRKPTLVLPKPARFETAPIQSKSRESADAALSKCERAILTVLAQHSDGKRKNQISILSGYSIKSSSFANALSSLRTKNYISGTGSQTMTATDDGLNALGDYDPLPTGQELLNYWLGQVGKCERAILECLAAAYPSHFDKQTVAEQSGYSITSSSFANALSRLRTLELITGQKDIRASDDLFD